MRANVGFCAVTLLSLSTKVAGILRATTTQQANTKGVITPAPGLHLELAKRALATCGYVRGNSASPVTCPQSYTCVTSAHAYAAFACCNSVECLNDWGVCNSYGAAFDCNGSNNIAVSACSFLYGSILSCSSDVPYCQRYARSSSRNAFQTQFSYACGTQSTDVLLLATATNDARASAAAASSAHIPGYTPASYGSGSSSSAGSGNHPSSGLTSRSIISIVTSFGTALFIVFVLLGVIMRRRRKTTNMVIPPAPPLQQSERPQQPPPPSYPSILTQNASPNQWAHVQPVHMPPGSTVYKQPEPSVRELGAHVPPMHEMSPNTYRLPEMSPNAHQVPEMPSNTHHMPELPAGQVPVGMGHLPQQ